ncbi:MAG: MBL fold metallo-hydrolase, partial [Deltaproteobacteria bacterium]|nr:MBL fold metallo-hydrolase [Deltaproteobacteria bacterium]
GIYIIGGPGISHFQDAAVFIVQCGDELVMIDSGSGKSSLMLQENISRLGLDPGRITALVLTHCHVDHIGSAKYFQDTFTCEVIAHDSDAMAIETGDDILTAASWYGTRLPQMHVDRKLTGEHEILMFGDDEIHCIHTPGHTPGSISLYLDRTGKRILFGQDIHGPFSPEFLSDIGQWRDSMEKLLALDADILCEGHYGIFSGREKVKRYIQGYLDQYASH